MPTIFISYSRTNHITVNDLADKLRGAGHTVWTDVSGIPGGAVWHTEIEHAITICDVLLVIVSASSKQSEWVQKEILFALDLHRIIIPVLIEETKLPLALINLQPIQYQQASIQAFSDLILAISKQQMVRSLSVSNPTEDETAGVSQMRVLSLAQFHHYLVKQQSDDEEIMS
jgi:hypothetical protein